MTSGGGSPTRTGNQAAVLLAVVVGSAILFVLATELVFRATGRSPNQFKSSPNFGKEGLFTPDPVTGWVNQPGRYRSVEPGRAWLTITESGLRATGRPVPTGGPEVLIVGASCTQGYGVADRDTFTHGLSRGFPNIAFSNLASGGFGSVQALLSMQRYIDARGDRPPPAVVIYGFAGRAANWSVASAPWVRQVTNESGQHIVPPHVEVVGGELVSRPGGVVPVWPFESRSALVTALHDAWLSHRYDATPEDGIHATVGVVTEMAREASARGSQLLVVLLTEPQPRVEAGLRENGVEVLDCQREDYETRPALKVGFHPSRLMHAYWTGCIGEWLENELGRR